MTSTANPISTAHAAANEFLNILGVVEPPLDVDMITDALGLSVHDLPRFDLDRLQPEDLRSIDSVRALLSPSERRIYVRPDMSASRAKFPIFHETGHCFIPWHQKALYLDNEYSLSRKTRDIMEKEANEFAAHLQFLGEQFKIDAAQRPFGLASALELKDLYDVSIESAIRHYVETNNRNCICQVFCIEGESLKLHYYIRPLKISTQLRWNPDCPVKSFLDAGHNISLKLREDKFHRGSVTEDLICVNPTLIMHQHIFCDGYRLFVLEFEAI